MSRNDPGHLVDLMLESAKRALTYVDGLSRDEFLRDTRTQEAVSLNLRIIGETAIRLSREHASLLAAHPEVPWRSMQGMRNRIAHGYFEIDMNIVWETVVAALPELVSQLPAIRDASARPDLRDRSDSGTH